LVVATGLATAGLTGCSASNPTGASPTTPPPTSPPSPAALAAVKAAVANTLTLTSAFDMTFSRSGPNSVAATPRDASGTVDFRAPSGAIRMDLPGASGGTEQMVFLTDTVFIEPPASSPQLQPGRPWVFANFADMATFNINFPPYIIQTESINPAFTLYELAWGSTAASPAGQVDFGQQPTNSYLATVNLNQALAHATGPAGDSFSHAITSEIAATDGGASGAPAILTIQVWVDRAGRLVGARVTPPGAGIGELTLALRQFGAVVNADKPPRHQVVDIAAMIPGAEQEALNNGDTDGA
jgi:hypothetical protein